MLGTAGGGVMLLTPTDTPLMPFFTKLGIDAWVIPTHIQLTVNAKLTNEISSHEMEIQDMSLLLKRSYTTNYQGSKMAWINADTVTPMHLISKFTSCSWLKRSINQNRNITTNNNISDINIYWYTSHVTVASAKSPNIATALFMVLITLRQ